MNQQIREIAAMSSSWPIEKQLLEAASHYELGRKHDAFLKVAGAYDASHTFDVKLESDLKALHDKLEAEIQPSR